MDHDRLIALLRRRSLSSRISRYIGDWVDIGLRLVFLAGIVWLLVWILRGIATIVFGGAA